MSKMNQSDLAILAAFTYPRWRMSAEVNNIFIELNRRFRRLEKSGKAEDMAIESHTRLFGTGRISETWDDILKESRAVVLGEPGSGKSWEFRERARQLKNSGNFAFFIRL